MKQLSLDFDDEPGIIGDCYVNPDSLKTFHLEVSASNIPAIKPSVMSDSIDEAIKLIEGLPDKCYLIGCPKIISYELARCRDIVDLLNEGSVRHNDVITIIDQLKGLNALLDNINGSKTNES